ncbi:MAG: creatininase family protein [Nitrososphaera sp.]|jgi:creatinine amidohydrolase
MILRDLTNTEFQNVRKSKKSVAIIPVGSIEQHGAHLPISTDSDIISYIAKKIAEKMGYFLLPTIQYGISFEHHPLVNLSISPNTLEKLLVDLCVSLYNNGIQKVVILNGHHGNQNALNRIPTDTRISSIKLQVAVYSYWHFMKKKFDHAGFVETSIMLAISDKVQMKKAKKGLIPDDLSKKELAKLSKMANKSFVKATKNGIWGDPTKANSRDGKKILDEIVRSLIKESQTWLTGKSRKLHQ